MRISMHFGAVALLLPFFAVVPVQATPIGQLNVDSCGGGVTVTAAAIEFVGPQCVQTGAGTSVDTVFGNLGPGVQGTINNINVLVPPGTINPFMTFPVGGNDLEFVLTSVGPGNPNTNCAAPPCSITPGSPFELFQVGNGSTVVLPASGTVSDGSGAIGNWEGHFSSNFSNLTPLALQQQFGSAKQLQSTTYSGSFDVTAAVPEPSSAQMGLFGAGLLALGLASRRRRVARDASLV